VILTGRDDIIDKMNITTKSPLQRRGFRGGLNQMNRKIIPYNPKLKALAKALRKKMTLSEVLLWQE
jgi:hypothetical protein